MCGFIQIPAKKKSHQALWLSFRLQNYILQRCTLSRLSRTSCKTEYVGVWLINDTYIIGLCSSFVPGIHSSFIFELLPFPDTSPVLFFFIGLRLFICLEFMVLNWIHQKLSAATFLIKHQLLFTHELSIIYWALFYLRFRPHHQSFWYYEGSHKTLGGVLL